MSAIASIIRMERFDVRFDFDVFYKKSFQVPTCTIFGDVILLFEHAIR